MSSSLASSSSSGGGGGLFFASVFVFVHVGLHQVSDFTGVHLAAFTVTNLFYSFTDDLFVLLFSDFFLLVIRFDGVLHFVYSFLLDLLFLFLFGAVGLSPVVLSGGGWQHVAGHWQDLGHRGSTSFVWSLEQRWLRETCHVPSHLCGMSVGQSDRGLTALLHGWRWRGRGRQTLGSHSGHLQQRDGWVQVHGDLRGRESIGRGGLKAHRQRASRAGYGVMMKDVQLRRHQHWHRGVTWDRLSRWVAFRRI